MGGSAFGSNPTGDKACFYESIGRAMLQTVPADLGTDHYRISFDMQHHDSAARAGGRSFAGVYFGHSEQFAPDGRPVYTFFALEYSDIHPNGQVGEALTHKVLFQTLAMILNPDGDDSLKENVIFHADITGTGPPAGKWRSFRIDVSPNKLVLAYLDEATGQFKLLGELAGDAIQRKYGLTQQLLPAGFPVTQWSPNLPAGIWSYRAAVAVRNFAITPLLTE
jgi:hypothetical protein